jgi:hypothetical protein
MNTIHTWQTILEVSLAALVIWAVFNEDKFIKFEDRIKKVFKKER